MLTVMGLGMVGVLEGMGSGRDSYISICFSRLWFYDDHTTFMIFILREGVF